ncbi:MAG: DUF4224 domain-containing protein [Rhodocyclaceae bacterium]|nr:DUF4224 domain-containing protein [Rhodocyclaceae bacterium]
MTAFFEMPIASETLAPEEIVQITGCARRADQMAWLQAEGWTFVKNKAGEPIVGRLYARLRLAGISTSTLTGVSGWAPDFTKIR